MIRAVSRYTVEINKTGSPYFERVICFVKPEYTQNDRLDLHRAAQQLISSLDTNLEESNSPDLICISSSESSREAPQPRSRFFLRLIPLALSAILGAGATLLFMLII